MPRGDDVDRGVQTESLCYVTRAHMPMRLDLAHGLKEQKSLYACSERVSSAGFMDRVLVSEAAACYDHVREECLQGKVDSRFWLEPQ